MNVEIKVLLFITELIKTITKTHKDSVTLMRL